MINVLYSIIKYDIELTKLYIQVAGVFLSIFLLMLGVSTFVFENFI